MHLRASHQKEKTKQIKRYIISSLEATPFVTPIIHYRTQEDAKSDSSLGCHDKAIFGEIKKDDEETDIISLNLPITAKRIEVSKGWALI